MEGEFHQGQPVWVVDEHGESRAAEYVGGAETSSWFGGPTRVIVVYLDTKVGEAVEANRVIPRDG